MCAFSLWLAWYVVLSDCLGRNSKAWARRCMIKIFSEEGVVDGEGVAVKDAWSGIIKGSFQKHFKTGV